MQSGGHMSREGTTTNRRTGNRAVMGEDPDLVRFYLDEIGATALLNAEQEVELAKRIEAGLFAQALLTEATAPGTPRLRAARRRDLERLVADGEAAKDHM